MSFSFGKWVLPHVSDDVCAVWAYYDLHMIVCNELRPRNDWLTFSKRRTDAIDLSSFSFQAIYYIV
jgi:hypothetical protein